MRKGEADSRPPVQPNDSLGKPSLPQWLLLGINHPFECCRTPKFQLPLSTPKKAHCPLGTWRSPRKSTRKTPTVQHMQLQLSPKFRELSPKFPPNGNQILELTSLFFLQLVLGIKMLESTRGTNNTSPTPFQTIRTNGPNASFSFSKKFSPIQCFPNDNQTT